MKTSVMLVDDTGLFRKQLRFILEKINFEVSCEAHNGQEALDLYPVHTPDVVLLDIQMPIMNGITALENFQALFPSVPIIMMTAFPSEEIVDECINKGARTILTKPIRTSDLELAIKSALFGDNLEEL